VAVVVVAVVIVAVVTVAVVVVVVAAAAAVARKLCVYCTDVQEIVHPLVPVKILNS